MSLHAASKTRRTFSVAFAPLLAGLLLSTAWGCGPASGGKEGIGPSEKDPHAAFDSLLELRYARGFAVAWRDGLAHVYVQGAQAGQESDALHQAKAEAGPVPGLISDRSFHYILLPKTGLEEQDSLKQQWPKAQMLATPIERAALISTTHAALFCALDARSSVVGLAWAENAVDTGLRKRHADGRLSDLGLDADINLEALVDVDPDLVMTYTTSDPAYGAYAKMRALGLPVAVNGEYKEAHPLAQAEWIRFAGLLLGKEAMADTCFAAVERRYQQWQGIAELWTKRSGTKPSVFTGMDWQGQWTVPEGQSFAARYLNDAGAQYLWSDSKGQGSLFLDAEQVLNQALEANYWLHPGAARNLSALQQADARVRHFRAFKEAMVFNNDARLSPSGGNDYWESAVVRPDRVLRDLVLIFHGPEAFAFSGHAAPELFYYRQLSAP